MAKKNTIDDVELIIRCGKCGKELREKIGRLRRNPEVLCKCGTAFRIDSQQLHKAAGPLEDDAQGKLF
jgi:hypothetical protein